MRLDLNADEAQWLKHALLFKIGYLKGLENGNHEAIALLEGILDRLAS